MLECPWWQTREQFGRICSGEFFNIYFITSVLPTLCRYSLHNNNGCSSDDEGCSVVEMSGTLRGAKFREVHVSKASEMVDAGHQVNSEQSCAHGVGQSDGVRLE